MQDILVIITLAGAVFYLGRKFYLQATRKSDCSANCGCEPVKSKESKA